MFRAEDREFLQAVADDLPIRCTVAEARKSVEVVLALPKVIQNEGEFRMKVLVTGGSGRIGYYILGELLEHGHRVVSCGRTPPSMERVPHLAADIDSLDSVPPRCAATMPSYTWLRSRTPSGRRPSNSCRPM